MNRNSICNTYRNMRATYLCNDPTCNGLMARFSAKYLNITLGKKLIIMSKIKDEMHQMIQNFIMVAIMQMNVHSLPLANS